MAVMGINWSNVQMRSVRVGAVNDTRVSLIFKKRCESGEQHSLNVESVSGKRDPPMES